MTLTTLNDNQPEWVKRELGLEEYKEFKLGQKVKFSDDWVYIIHIQEDKTGEVLFRGMLPNGASITMLYDLINKPVETTKAKGQPKLTQRELNSFKTYISRSNSKSIKDLLSKKTWDKIENVLETNTLSKFNIVSCCNSQGKCNCETYGEINSCEFSC